MGEPGHLVNQLWLDFSACRTVDIVCPECTRLVWSGRPHVYVVMNGPDALLHISCFVKLFVAHDSHAIPGFGEARLTGGFPCAVCQKTVNRFAEAHAFTWRAQGELEVRVVHDHCCGGNELDGVGIPSGAACAPLPYRPEDFKT